MNWYMCSEIRKDLRRGDPSGSSSKLLSLGGSPYGVYWMELIFQRFL